MFYYDPTLQQWRETTDRHEVADAMSLNLTNAHDLRRGVLGVEHLTRGLGRLHFRDEDSYACLVNPKDIAKTLTLFVQGPLPTRPLIWQGFTSYEVLHVPSPPDRESESVVGTILPSDHVAYTAPRIASLICRYDTPIYVGWSQECAAFYLYRVFL